MRLKSEIWVRAYVRRCQGEGSPAVIVRRGDRDAGAIFILVNRLDGSVLLFGPAPAGLASSDTERRFAPHLGGEAVAEAEASMHLAREANFDSDIWVVEVENRDGRSFLEDWLAPEGD